MDTFRNYIGGEWRDAEGGATRLDPNPSDDQDPIGLLPDSVVARGAKCQCEMGGKNPLVILADAPRSSLPSWPSKGRSAPAVRSALPRAG